MTPSGEMLFALIALHALCDFPLQGDYLAKLKALPTDDGRMGLMMHVVIHGAAVWFVTSAFWLGIAECVAHYGIDTLKIRGKINFVQDQYLHVACKSVWVGLLVIKGFL